MNGKTANGGDEVRQKTALMLYYILEVCERIQQDGIIVPKCKIWIFTVKALVGDSAESAARPSAIEMGLCQCVRDCCNNKDSRYW